ncbi:DegT/DnrJ/EryC1/StrS family aminotransferase [bacterium]|nr:DegT/DnrJ/EryC1/StrS family aminotransferase [bacterium]
MSVPIFNLKRQYARIKDELEPKILDVLSNGMYIGGKILSDFENDFARYCGTRFAIGVNSGTDALIISLRAVGIKSGDEVIVPSFTFFATAEAVANIGAVPVFADVDYGTMCIDPKSIANNINERTRAIIPVHLFGHPAAMDEINAVALENGLTVIEDACQSVGSLLNGKKAGSIGAAGAFSFYPTKNLSAAGDGGIITTNSEHIATESRKLRSHGEAKRYNNEMLGYNSRLDAIQATVLSVKLKHLDDFNNLRRHHAELYSQLFADIEQVKSPIELNGMHHTYHQYTIRVPSEHRDNLVRFLGERKIGVAIYYPIPVHKLGPFAGTTDDSDLPITMRLAGEVLSLPIFPELRDDEIEEVADTIVQYFD